MYLEYFIIIESFDTTEQYLIRGSWEIVTCQKSTFHFMLSVVNLSAKGNRTSFCWEIFKNSLGTQTEIMVNVM